MSKFNSYLLTVLLSLATAFICIQSFGPVQIKKIEAASSATVNAVQQGMIGNDKTDNTPILQKIVKNSGSKVPLTINIPKGTYLFTNAQMEAVKLRSDLTFNFENGATFKVSGGNHIIFVYPSTKKGYSGGIKNIKWNNATFKGGDVSAREQSYFVQSVHHATAVNFNNATFYNCQPREGHLLDLTGSHDIYITNSTFEGFNPSSGAEYKEAIQVDYSNEQAMAYNISGDQYDNLPSYDVHVTNSKFLPITNSNGGIKFYAPNPIGEHAIYTNPYAGMIHDVYFKGNYVQDTVPLKENQGSNLQFLSVSNLYIENNTFENNSAKSSDNYFRLYNTQSNAVMNNLNIKNNKFINVNPKKRYIYVPKIGNTGAIKKVSITGNTIRSSKTSIPFVQSNFGTTGMTIKNNLFSTSSAAQVKTSKKKKQTNKYEKYYSVKSSTTARFKKNAKKHYTLYTHIKGHKNWKYASKKLKNSKTKKVYVDKRAKASSGKWYRIRFDSKSSSQRYWIRTGALTLK
ncbi:hypothetical protein C5L31_000865 [Secundilactobacillus malefermentans]|uniref:GW domain-containing protein n=2 Tax=Secundilactobacillus malefermentans TaxID=176292 RepID=A0A4R5NM20_9LACO|nr:GW dipeptide domain-containing protein [Secundilactobacillus malefermentans]KRM59246.1 hypothetical protein FD44_GL001883 [Secundilactobacillus malefermentans DSM 5705 = KCTC 3548]QEA32558.1 N-acetylmuramoyl-L-alanine amidase [Secundilactobacillus malefermentans]TDG76252.1 hypothetical protein C5L31_000865 [Secundilactobacillus malefermentans]